MFARLTILQVPPENLEKGIALFRRSVVPEAKRQKGYRGACLLSDPKSGKGIAVTFWRSEKDAVANEESRYYQEQLVKALQFLSAPPIREGYIVNLHAWQDAPRPRAAEPPPGRSRGKDAGRPSSPGARGSRNGR